MYHQFRKRQIFNDLSEFFDKSSKWNQAIITQETTRIISKSGCNYLEDLVTCVHISQLKILTSIRVASKQKKVDIDIPKLSEFIHYCYIQFARKLYSNVYLFETKVSSLQMQKNHRECELLCKECILNVIRNNIPVDKILRAYIDETTEEEVIEESKVEEKPVDENAAPPPTPVDTQKVDDKPDATQSTNKETLTVEKTLSSVDVSKEKKIVQEEIKKVDIPPPVPPNSPAAANTEPKVPTNLSFNDTDKVINYNKKENTSAIQSNTAETIIAPKTLKRLEEISVQRHKERKEEDAGDDDDEEKIKILNTPVDMKLGELDIHVLDDKVSLQKEVLKDIIPLK